MDNDHLTEIPTRSSPSTLSPASVPLHLSGFLSGETIRVQGETGNLEFSLQFNIHHKQNCHDQASLSSSVSSYMTPITTHEDEDQEIVNTDAPFHTADLIPEKPESDANNREAIITRLRSGVLSPISYDPLKYSALPDHKISRNVRKSKEKKRGTRDVLETVLKRRSFPVRPCNSYGFFVITTWGMVRHSSFKSTSKKIGKMWSKLPQDERKMFEDMAAKDAARYKRQCMLLKSDTNEGKD